MITTQKTTSAVTFAVGEKALWVTPSGYKEVVTVVGHGVFSNTVVVRTMYGSQIRFMERSGRFIGVEQWGHLVKKFNAAPVGGAKTSIWDRIKNVVSSKK